KNTGDWDLDALANNFDLSDLVEWGFEEGEFGLGEIESEGNTDEDAVPETPEDPETKLCDLYKLGKHRLLCGDATDVQAVERLMDGELADMVFTDPPYGVGYEGKTKDKLKIKNDSMSELDFSDFIMAIFNGVDIAMRDGAYILMTAPPGPQQITFLLDWKKRGWLRQIMVWNKDSMVLGHSEYHYKHEPIIFGWKPGERLKCTDRAKTSVWDFDRPKKSKEHPTMKPVEMWVYGINNHSLSGNIIYEPCGGSGTTLIACEKTSRVCYGMELDPKYCDVIVKRW
ncbi:unnamed protein product, partial [marine sediment metagenome]